MDLFHPSHPNTKVAECCTMSGYLGEHFHGTIITEGMVKVNVGTVIDETCPLIMTVEEDLPPQLTLANVKRGITIWPSFYIRPHTKNVT